MSIRIDLSPSDITILVWSTGKCVVLACKTIEQVRAVQDALAPWLANFVVLNPLGCAPRPDAHEL
jgi:hypothetical protein